MKLPYQLLLSYPIALKHIFHVIYVLLSSRKVKKTATKTLLGCWSVCHRSNVCWGYSRTRLGFLGCAIRWNSWNGISWNFCQGSNTSFQHNGRARSCRFTSFLILAKQVNMVTVVEFLHGAVEIQYFLQLNDPSKRIFWYLVWGFDWGLSKIGHFQCQFLRSKINSIFLKMIFLSKYQSTRTTFNKNIWNLKHTQKSLFSKNVP